jgi:hypothetical protein
MAKKSSSLGLMTIDPTREGVLQGYKNLNSMNSVLAGKEYAAAALPYEMADEFKKRQDPALNEKISKSEQAMLGGYTAGLYKFQDISNPFQRRSLAQQYKGNLSMTYDALTSEKDRRTGKYLDYIEKYTGLFSADIARERAMINSYQEQIGQAKEMWRTDVEDRRYEESKAKAKEDDRSLYSIAQELKEKGINWGDAASELGKKYDLTPGSEMSQALDYVYGGAEYYNKLYNKPEEEQPTQWETEREDQSYINSIIDQARSAGKKDKEIKEKLKELFPHIDFSTYNL